MLLTEPESEWAASCQRQLAWRWGGGAAAPSPACWAPKKVPSVGKQHNNHFLFYVPSTELFLKELEVVLLPKHFFFCFI